MSKATDEYQDPVIEAYKRDVDRTLLRENLKLTIQERLDKFWEFMLGLDEFRTAGERMRRHSLKTKG